MKILSKPTEKDIRSLELGDVVYITGDVITGRDEMHMRALKYLREGKEVPSDIYNSILYHCGPIMSKKNGGWKVVAAGPTTSARMNSLESDMIRSFGLRAIIGKGGMSADVSAAMEEIGCVYLAATGGAAVSLAECLSADGAEWEDLGMAEAMWRFRAERLGPLVVAMDSCGNSLYENVRASLRRA